MMNAGVRERGRDKMGVKSERRAIQQLRMTSQPDPKKTIGRDQSTHHTRCEEHADSFFPSERRKGVGGHGSDHGTTSSENKPKKK